MTFDTSLYETVIGLEIHVELSTKTKLFCSCPTGFGQTANSCICPVCTGMPGALPVLNHPVVEYAVATGLALNCEISRYSAFDRKNYFYPDNPQNYQISQLYLPIARNGHLTLTEAVPAKTIRIHEIHMEDDAGKLVHAADGTTLVDYNRSGVPLLEIVTEPDFRSADEVIAFLEQLRLTLLYLGVSDCRLQEGSLRVDVNLSVRKPDAPYGTRTETKNLNSFRAITHAITHERERQIALIEAGQNISQETRRFDDTTNSSRSMRSKEDSNDYRYFPEPDLPPLALTDSFINHIRNQLPELRDAKRERYQAEYGLSAYDVSLITSYKKLADLFEQTVQCGANPKKTANRLMVDTLALCREYTVLPEELMLSPKSLAALLSLTDSGRITGAVSKEIFHEFFRRSCDHSIRKLSGNQTASLSQLPDQPYDFDPEQYAIDNHLLNNSDASFLSEVADAVILNNPQSVSDYNSGKTKALAFLVGQAMKLSKGTLDPTQLRLYFENRLPSAQSLQMLETPGE